MTDSVQKVDAEAIQRILLNRICLLEYRPGDQLKESALALELGVSRTPIRDALNRISHLGLIESRNGVGTVVVGLTREQLRHVYEVRLELSCLIGKLSPITPGPEHCEALRHLLDRATELTKDVVPDEFVRINHELNELVASMIGNTSLRSMWLQVYVQAASTWHRLAETIGSDATQALVEELTALLAAAQRGDSDAIGHVQRIYIGYSFRKLEEISLI